MVMATEASTDMKEFFLYIWQLPQNLLGIILVLFYRPESHFIVVENSCRLRIYTASRFPSGISLGKYIIMQSPGKVSLRHEIGHSYQSRKLGWLYIPVIGIWSFTRCWLRLFKTGEYYTHFPESQADKLGGVKWHDGKRTTV